MEGKSNPNEVSKFDEHDFDAVDEHDDDASVFPYVNEVNFHEFCQGLQESEESIIQFETLRQLSSMAEFAEELYVLDNIDDRQRNRYLDVVPFTKNRVRLAPVEGFESGYINASHVEPSLCGAKATYIAAQAPIPSVIGDWWRMVWEQDILLVIMLTNFVESGRMKADKYWPEIGKGSEWGDIRVDLVAEEQGGVNGSIVSRTLLLTKNNGDNPPQERVVFHIQYMVWPDFSTPDSFESFLNLFALYRSYRDPIVKERTSPVLVHCSAGIGRTGVFIALDQLLDHITHQRQHNTRVRINIFNVVQRLREQRFGTVQTQEQYAFLFYFLDHCLSNGRLGTENNDGEVDEKQDAV